MNRQAVGRRGEAIARRHLEVEGYRVLETNCRVRSGEIDIVACHDGTLVFAEVRTRHAQGFGAPEESITPAKRRKLADTAHEYLQKNDIVTSDWRIDVVLVEFGGRGRSPRVEVIANAVEESSPDLS